MNDLLSFLIEHGVMLAGGATLLLTLGGLALLAQRSPIHRQRTGEITIVAVLLWLGLAAIPLPRWSTFDSAATPTQPKAPQNEISNTAEAPLHSDLAFSSSDVAARNAEAEAIINKLAQLDAELAQSGVAPYEQAPSDLEISEKIPAPAAESPSIWRRLPWGRIFAASYLLGGGLCAAWLIFGRLLLLRLTRQAAPPEEWLAQLYQSLSTEPLPPMLVSPRCRSPFSCGWRRPTIVLPATGCHPLQAGRLRQILLHELAHIRQRDQRGRLLFNLALPLLYAHPLYWWIRDRTYLAAELVADDWAAGHTSSAAYAEELISLVKEQGRRGLAHVGTVGVFSSPTQFYRRMEMLVRRQTPLMTACGRRWRLLTLLTATLTVALLGSVYGVRHVQAEPDDETPVAATEGQPSTDGEAPDEEKLTGDEATPAAETNADHVPGRGFGLGRRGDGDDDDGGTGSRGFFGSGPRGGDGDDEGETGGWGSSRGGRRGDDDEGFAEDRGGFGGGSRRRRLGGLLGFEVKDWVAYAKRQERDVLTLRLKMLNRRNSDDSDLHRIMTAPMEEFTNQQIAEDLVKLFQKPTPGLDQFNKESHNDEINLVKQILELSENRREGILHVLVSMDKLDDASKATLLAMSLEEKLEPLQKNVAALVKLAQAESDLEENSKDHQELIPELDSTADELRKQLREANNLMSELIKADKALAESDQKNQPRKNYWYYNKTDGDPKIPGHSVYTPKYQPPKNTQDQNSRRSNDEDITPPQKQNVKVVPKTVKHQRVLPNGRVVEEEVTVYELMIENEKDENTPLPGPISSSPYQPSPPGAINPQTNKTAKSPQQIRAEAIEASRDSRLPDSHHDVIKLATDYSQTHSKLESAKRTYERSVELKERNVISQSDFQKAETELASTRERLKTMQTIAEVLQESLKAELNALQIEMEQAGKTKDAVRKAQLDARITRVVGDLKILRTMK